MAAVIALISLLVVLLSGLTTGLSNQSVSAITSLPADQLSFAQPADGQKVSFDTTRVTAKQVATVAERGEVAEAQPLGIAPTRLRTGGNDVQVSAFGAEPGSYLAPAKVSGDSIVVSNDLAQDEGLQVGDSVTIDGRELTIAGARDNSSFNHMPVVWMSLKNWQHLGSAGGAYASVIATTGSPDIGAVDRAAGLSTTDLGGSLSAVGSYTAENASLTLMRVLLMAVSALVVGAFFTVWTIQRAPDLAVLKAMGASTRYLVRDALVQAFVVLLIGGGIGTLLAGGLGLLAAQAVPFVVSPGTTLVPLAGLLIVGMIGAAASLRQISTVAPLTALGAAR